MHYQLLLWQNIKAELFNSDFCPLKKRRYKIIYYAHSGCNSPVCVLYSQM